MNTAFSLENISIGFNGVPVLRNVNFALGRNEVHAIAGRNGAGKSTLMKVLTGIYKPNSGKVTILGQELGLSVTAMRPDSLCRAVAMVYQDLSLVPSMTVTQNIFLHHHPFRLRPFGLLDDAKARKAVREIFAYMGGIDFISPDALVSDLSVGEAQLVEIAKALAGKPQIVVFDEPTAALSRIETAQLFQTIQVLKKQGISIIYITHYLEDVMQICDSITVLRNGEVVFSAAIKDTSIAEIVQNMLGQKANKQLFQRNKNFSTVKKSSVAMLEVCEATTAHVGPLNLQAHPGEIIGLAGLLGSGRSEIFRLLYGLDPLLAGEVKIRGQKVFLSHPNSAMKHGISLVPEERRTQGLVLDFSIMHNLSLNILQRLRKACLLQSKQEINYALQSIENLQIKAKDIYQAVRFLSGGNQQKVVFGKCLLAEPSILLLDDPTFGIDVHAKSEIMKIIESFASKGNTVLFITSELEEIANFCDRTYIVKKKNIVEEVMNINEEELVNRVQ